MSIGFGSLNAGLQSRRSQNLLVWFEFFQVRQYRCRAESQQKILDVDAIAIYIGNSAQYEKHRAHVWSTTRKAAKKSVAILSRLLSQ